MSATGWTEEQLARFALRSDDPSLEPMWKQLARQQVREGQACAACLGLGWQRPGEFQVGHPQFGKLVRCDVCSKDELPTYLRRISGLTGWQASARFKDYYGGGTRLEQLEAAQGLVKRGYGWLALWGGFGQSKTYLLCAIVNHYLAAGQPAVYVTAGKLLDHLRDAYAPGEIGFSRAFSHWAGCRVLAIDEADKFHQTSWAMDKYHQLLDHRYNLAEGKQAITAFACNPRPGGDSWPRELGWLFSRMTRFEICEAKGGDIRPVLAEETGYTPWEDKYS